MEANTEHQEQFADPLAPVLRLIVRQFEELVKQLWTFSQSQPLPDLAVLEAQARQLSKECFAQALQTAIELHRQRIEERWWLGWEHCECGGVPQNKGAQKRTLQTWVGSITVKRGYYYCTGCGRGRYPLDEAMGIRGGEGRAVVGGSTTGCVPVRSRDAFRASILHP